MNSRKIPFWLGVLLVSVASSFGQIWTQTSAPNRTWAAVVSSADQSKLIAVTGAASLTKGIYISTNLGVSWTPVSTANAGCVASSADGVNLVALSDSDKGVITSTDGGTTWHKKFPVVPSGNWASVASSGNGSNLVAISDATGTGIFTSQDAGNTWALHSTPFGGYSVASSADGTKLYAALQNNCIYISTNSGTTWKTNITLSGSSWISLASAADGNKLVAAAYGGKIYSSTNSGVTWKTNSVPVANWNAIASSADGSKLVAAIQGGQIYASTNSGSTWKTNNAPNNSWTSLASSADGNQLAVADYNTGGIWVAQSMPKPTLNCAVSGGQLGLSWIIPSTKFVLRQSADLVSWTDVTNSCVLEFTNLQNEVTLPMSGVSGFYRLQTP